MKETRNVCKKIIKIQQSLSWDIKKWNLYYEIRDGKLNDKEAVNKMFLMTKMKLYLDEMREKIQLLISYQ